MVQVSSEMGDSYPNGQLILRRGGTQHLRINIFDDVRNPNHNCATSVPKERSDRALGVKVSSKRGHYSEEALNDRNRRQ